MDERGLSLAKGFVSASYIQAGSEALRSNERVVRSILAQRRCPEKGMSDVAIEQLLNQLALMDSNNFAAHVGAGEREGRVAAPLVARRHYGLSHGIGRSGDVLSDQPKAAGSSLLHKVTNCMVLDLLRQAGAPSTETAVVFPMATGMTLSLVLRSVAKQQRDERRVRGLNGAGSVENTEECEPRYVVWTRIDQKTALKCIEAAGFVPLVVPLRPASLKRQDCSGAGTRMETGPHPYFFQAHVDDIAAVIQRLGGPKHVVCVLSTTSCFAPRLPDDVVAISQLCKTLNVPYVVNNAYGVQSRVIMRRIDAAIRLGRVDAVVQSGDKNFLVPVGGAVLSGPKDAVMRVAAMYAGRGSISPVVDLFITSLSLGRSGFQQLWDTRYVVRELLVDELRKFAHTRGEVLLEENMEVNGDARTRATVDATPCENQNLPRNDISLALTMRTVKDVEAARAIGARLFRGAVTGPRVVVPNTATTRLCGLSFLNYGMHTDEVPSCPLLVMACGIGMTAEDVHAVVARLEEVWPSPVCVCVRGTLLSDE